MSQLNQENLSQNANLNNDNLQSKQGASDLKANAGNLPTTKIDIPIQNEDPSLLNSENLVKAETKAASSGPVIGLRKDEDIKAQRENFAKPAEQPKQQEGGQGFLSEQEAIDRIGRYEKIEKPLASDFAEKKDFAGQKFQDKNLAGDKAPKQGDASIAHALENIAPQNLQAKGAAGKADFDDYSGEKADAGFEKALDNKNLNLGSQDAKKADFAKFDQGSSNDAKFNAKLNQDNLNRERDLPLDNKYAANLDKFQNLPKDNNLETNKDADVNKEYHKQAEINEADAEKISAGKDLKEAQPGVWDATKDIASDAKEAIVEGAQVVGDAVKGAYEKTLQFFAGKSDDKSGKPEDQ